MNPRQLFTAIIVAALLVLSGCNSPVHRDDKDKNKVQFDIKNLAKSDVDSVLDRVIEFNFTDLRRLMEKLYKRNPREWKKTGVTPEERIAQIFDGEYEWRFEELEGKRDIEAMRLSVDPDYPGDRVFALIAGLVSMIYKSYGNRTEIFLLSEVDPQSIYHSARNVELVVWLLGKERDARGELLLYTNSIPGEPLNLSYERLFGKIIARQDLVAHLLADRENRTIRAVITSFASLVFFPI
ncbi:MAG: hypothetical protein ACPGU7_15030 [Gammaproteobacteria bacterium]